MGGRSTHTHNIGERVAGMTIQTSLLGQVIPIGWGRGRLSCNLIDYVAFTPIAHTTSTTSSTGGGKGGGGSTTTTDTTYTYTASIELGICEGPITGINAVWKDSSYFSGSGALASAGLSVALGTSSQTPWGYLTSLYPDHALAYRTLAYAYAQDYDLGSTGIVANHSFEVDFAVQFNPGGGIYDAVPADILTDFMTNADHGLPSWPASVNGDWSDWALYTKAANLLLSPVLDQQITASEFLRRLLDETHSDCFFSEGVLKIKPLADDSVSYGGFTWNANLTPVYSLTEGDFQGEVQLAIQDQGSTYNYVQVEYLDRTNQYQTAVAIAYDLDDIVTFGRRMQTPQQFHDICDPVVARSSAQLWLQRNLFIRDQYTFDLPADFDLIEPMDYLSLTTTVDGMVLDNLLVRVIQIDEDQDGQDILHFTAEGVPGHTGTSGNYAVHSPAGNSVNVEESPGSVATPVLINAPASLTTSGNEAWAAVCGTSSAWGGAVVWVSFDGTNYSQIGTVGAPARFGTLTAAFPTGTDPDTSHTLSVDLTVSKGALASAGTADADADTTLCLVDSELIAYSTANLTSAYHYDLTSYLRRGQRGSVIAAHSIGASFVRLDSAIFRYAYDPSYVGQTIQLKFQSFNVYGRALQDLSTCTAYSMTLNPGPSLPGQVTGLAVQGGTTWTGPDLTITCNAVARATGYTFQIYKSDGVTLVRSLFSSTPGATYSSSLAAIDGALREYKINCFATTSAGNGPTSSMIDVTNAAPAALSGVSATGGATDASVTCTASASTDLAGYVVFYSNTTGFNPATQGNVVTSGTNTVTISGLPAGTYYGKMAAFDAWTYDPTQLNLSSQFSFTISTGGGGTPTGSGGGGTGASGGGGGGYSGQDKF